MSIRLETSKHRGVSNTQVLDLTDIEIKNASKLLKELYPNATERTRATSLYNCHGLTFASRRTNVFIPTDINAIIQDDNYRPVSMEQVRPGDIVVYYSENGDAAHSGVVIEFSIGGGVPLIFSKWGYGGEFVHLLNDCPAIYGQVHKFYRCEP